MDALCLGVEIGIKRAHYDPAMTRLSRMQADEVLSVERQHTAPVLVGESQHLLVRHLLVVLAGITRGKHVVPQGSQSFDGRQREIFVSVESGIQAVSFSMICLSISSRCLPTYAHALLRSSGPSVG